MNAYQLEATLSEDGTLMLEGLPFRSGELVKVIVLKQANPLSNSESASQNHKSLEAVDAEYLSAVSAMMTEWESEADELAYHDL